MTISHSLKNTGRVAIASKLYNHNFLVLDHIATGPDYVITMPFAVTTKQPPNQEMAQVRANRIRVTGDQPLASVALWSIRSVLAVEPFINVAVESGKEMVWNYTYTYYTVARN